MLLGSMWESATPLCMDYLLLQLVSNLIWYYLESLQAVLPIHSLGKYMMYWYLEIILLIVVSVFPYEGGTVLEAIFLRPNLQLSCSFINRAQVSFFADFQYPFAYSMEKTYKSLKPMKKAFSDHSGPFWGPVSTLFHPFSKYPFPEKYWIITYFACFYCLQAYPIKNTKDNLE